MLPLDILRKILVRIFPRVLEKKSKKCQNVPQAKASVFTVTLGEVIENRI